jgi:hypothetical protein
VEQLITTNQAFTAMVIFLEGFYERTKSDDVAGLLGDLILMADGNTADPAAWLDWLESIERSKT